MSVLIEAISIVVSNRVLEERYPGGVTGFARDCPNATFCTDGYVSRVGFMCMRDTLFFLGMLEACGIDCTADGPAGEAVVVDQNTGPTQPCLWLEFSHSEAGVAVCWHTCHPPGKLYVPYGWDMERLDAFHSSPGVPFPRRLRFLRTEDSQDWYQDRRTGELLCVERTFTTH